jgi:hypothetical protein
MNPWVGGARRALFVLAAAAGAVSAAAQGAAPTIVPPDAPSKGDVVKAFETTSIDGKAQKVDFPGGSKTVLLFFLSGCPACHKMIPEWNSAYTRKPKQLRVIGLLMDQEPPGFWSSISIRFPVLRAPSRELLRKLHVNRVPLTVRVGEGGRIEDVVLGVVDPIRLGELFRP